LFELNCTWDKKEIERRKQRIRDAWNYKKVDHIPINFSIWSNPGNFSTWDFLQNDEKNLELSLRCLQRSIGLLPDDYIPVLKPDKGYPIISQIYGAPITWGRNKDQWPGVSEKIIKKYEDFDKIKKPDVYKDGWGPELNKRMKMFKKVAGNNIYLTGYDIAGPFIIAHDLVETNLFFEAMKENPLTLHTLLEKITGTYNEFENMIVSGAGGLDFMTCAHWDTLWAPEGQKGYIADDLAVMISPDDYDIFCKPYNNEHFSIYGGGTIHNCGPQYMARNFLSHNPKVRALNFDYEKSKADFNFIGKICANKAVVSVWFPDIRMISENLPPAEAIVELYKKMIECFLPGTIGILEYLIDDSVYSDKEILEIYHMLHKLSQDYAKNIEWA
jgi:hypothetical protein